MSNKYHIIEAEYLEKQKRRTDQIILAGIKDPSAYWDGYKKCLENIQESNPAIQVPDDRAIEIMGSEYAKDDPNYKDVCHDFINGAKQLRNLIFKK